MSGVTGDPTEQLGPEMNRTESSSSKARACEIEQVFLQISARPWGEGKGGLTHISDLLS